jgi:hypothetical protein
MIASPVYRQLPSKTATSLGKYVTQQSLAVLMFIALAVVASVENKPSGNKKSDLNTNVSISESADQQRRLSLNPRRLFGNVVGSIKDAFNDPAVIEYANQQGVDIPDSLTPSCPNTSQPNSVISKSRSNQSSEPSFNY